MIRVLIIDYEAHMRDSPAKLLARLCPQVSVVGEAFNVTSGIQRPPGPQFLANSR